jgi:serine/threonine protein kinase
MIGTKLAHYEITAHLGSGGMGKVYQATDLKLGRSVALKFLPEAFVQDIERAARFEREARVLASLNHPHIAAIYDLAHFGDARFLVLELVEGETLADRLGQGPVPVQEALQIAKQIADGLEAAHEKGVIHRDLKPANIKITPSGNVKVLDFGLAKVRGDESRAVSNAPTKLTYSVSGTLMGTPAYMSPEQTKGKDADRSTDVWAFGCVLYEMLTGRAVFEGETVSEIFAGILTVEPDWRRLPAETPESIRRLLQRCLRKEQSLRFRDIGDVRIEIEEAGAPQIKSETSRSNAHRKERIILVSVIALLALVAAFTSRLAFRSAPPPSEMRLEITTPPTSNDDSLAISSDGRKVVFVAMSDGRPRLWIRSLDSTSPRPLNGTDYASLPFWSPDNESIGFFADGKLKRIDINGGSAQVVANAPFGRGGAWNRDGTILFAPTPGTPLLRTSLTGGDPKPVTKVLLPQQVGHGFPQFLPDGNHFLYSVAGNPEVAGIYIGQLDGPDTKLLVEANHVAFSVAAGQLLFVRERTLFAQKFDPAGLKLSGTPNVLTDNVGIRAIAASPAGPIVYRSASTSGGRRELIWLDRSGKEIGKVDTQTLAVNSSSSLSPDGRRVAFFGTLNGNADIWLVELMRGVLNRFTIDPADEIFPVWSPAGDRLVFSSNRKTRIQDLYRKSVQTVPTIC